MSFLKIDGRLLTFLAGVWVFSILAMPAAAQTLPKPPKEKFLPVSVVKNSDIRYLPNLESTLIKLNGALLSGNSLAVSEHLEAVIKHKKRLRSNNLFFVSRFLLAIAGQLESSGNLSRAAQTANDAARISPDDYRAWFALARYNFMVDKANAKSYLKPLLFGVVSFFKDSYNLLLGANRLLKIVVPALIVAYALFVFVGLAASGRLLAMEIARVVNMSKKSAAITLTLLIAAIFVAGGFFWLALAAPLLSWGYLQSSRRKVTVAFIIFIASLPFIVELAGRGVALENSRLYRAAHTYLAGNWEPDSVRTLVWAGGKKPDDTELWYALANLYRRAGDTGRARKYIDRVLAKESTHVKAINEMANLSFELKQFREAEILYKKALDVTSDSAELHYNMNKTYLELFRTERAAEEFNIAMRIDKEKTETFVKQGNDKEASKVVSFLADLKSMPLLEKEIGRESREAADVIWAAFAGPFDRNMYLAGAAVYLLVMAVAAALWRRPDRHTACTSCGDLFLPAVRSPGQEEFRCNQCVVLSSPRQKVDKAKKAKKLGQIKDHLYQVKRRANLFNYSLPGLGNVYIGNYRSGVILLCITSVFLVKIFFMLSPLLAEYRSALYVPVAEYIGWGIALFLFYLISALMLRQET
jgi:tetratricopeptide (TPR) repeat protein